MHGNPLAEAKMLVEKLSRMLNKLNLHSSVPQIEIDLMKDHLRRLYDLTNQFQPDEAMEHKDALTPVVEPVKQTVPDLNTKEISRSVEEEPLFNKKELRFEETEEIHKPTEQKPNRITHEQSSLLNEKLHAEKEILADKIKVKSTNDLRSIIDLNDRFFFTKELFNGDGYAFDKAVRFLNGITNFNDAKVYIEKELSLHYNWKLKQDAVNKFYQVIKSRFSGQ
ncbi:MAG: hypothetical protein ACK4IY_06350 [Chitinophagales bacterium]